MVVIASVANRDFVKPICLIDGKCHCERGEAICLIDEKEFKYLLS